MGIGIGLNTVAGKVLASTAVLASAATVASLGTFGAFTGTTSADLQVTSGKVNIALGTANTNANRLTVNAAGVVPGDTIQRAATLTNTGDQTLASIKLDTSATVSSLLDTDVTNGLKVTVDRCATAWTEANPSANVYTYTCSGGSTPVVTSNPVVGSYTVASSPALAVSGNDYLRVTLTLPTAADNTFQDKSSTIKFLFTGAQRAADAR